MPDRGPTSDRRSGPVAATSSLEGVRVLVVEDEFLLAVLLEQDLRSAGCSIIGPFVDLAGAIEGSRRNSFDVAVLDVNLSGDMVYPLADELIAREVPFVFLTGYGTMDMPERFRSLPCVAKPYDSNALLAALRMIATAAP